MIRALFNDRPLIGPRTGVGQYLTQVLSHWPDDPRTQPRGVIHTLTRGRLAPLHPPPAPPRAAAPALFPLSELRPGTEGASGLGLARRAFERAMAAAMIAQARGGRAGVVFEPNHIPPPIRVAPTVTTIHDLSVLERPDCHPPHRVRAWERGLARAIETSDAFICVSDTTAAAMTRVLGVPPERLCTIPLAARWTPEAPASPPPGLPERYWVHLGTIEPRKNVGILLDALEAMTGRQRAGTALVLAGRAGWGSVGFWSELLGHPMAERVLCAGFLTDEQTRGMVAGARGVLCPSVYEGFGLPALEAMALGVPVVVSTAPSLVEVTAGTCPALDAGDAGAWAGAMLELCEDGPERQGRIERARRRAAEFSWARTARAHDEVLARTAGPQRS